jgi:flagellar hook-associated protein 3 FlgL
MMRVTQNMLSHNLLRNLHANMDRMNKTQYKLETGKEVRFPSDDPVRAVRGMKHRTSLNEITQFQDNIKDAMTWNEYTDTVLSDITNALQRIRELVVYSGDGGLEETSLKAIADEIKQLTEHIGTAANSQIAGRYIFAGTDTLNPPFDAATQTWTNTNTEKIEVEISRGVYLPINLNGTELFTPGGGKPAMFDLLHDIVDRLESGQSATDYLDEMNTTIDHVLSLHARVGAAYNRLQLSEQRIGDLELQTTDLLAQAEDADLAEVIIDLKNQENVHQAALGVGARIIQPTLMDFLR